MTGKFNALVSQLEQGDKGASILVVGENARSVVLFLHSRGLSNAVAAKREDLRIHECSSYCILCDNDAETRALASSRFGSRVYPSRG